MGCRYSKVIGCYSLTCCCCVVANEACWWIGAVGVVWGGLATLVDVITAHLPKQDCRGCLDHNLNAKLSLAAGCINIVQWVASVLLLYGARKENKWLLVPWLAWSIVSLTMLLVWVVVTLPYMPSFRGMVSLFQLAWGIHYSIVIRTQYCRLALKFIPPEETSFTVPPNTPVRRHKRRWRRLHPGCQPAIRVLLGTALRLHEDFHRDVRMDENKDENEEDEKEDEEEGEVVSVVVGAHGSIAKERDEKHSCSRRRGRRTMTNVEEKPGSREELEAHAVIIHTADRDVRSKMEQWRPLRGEDEDENEDKDEGVRLYHGTHEGRGETVAMLWRASHPRPSPPTD